MSFDRYYKPTHVEWRKKCRDFVEAEIMPNVSQWEKDKALPRDIYAKTADAGYSFASWTPRTKYD